MQNLKKEIDYIIDRLDDIENLAYTLKHDVNEFNKYEIVDNKIINDIDLFKEKLIQAGLYSDTLNNFIDDYIKFYNE